MNDQTLILFDVGSVQLKLDFSIFFHQLEKISNIDKNKIKTDYNDSGLEYHLLKGNIDVKDYLAKLSGLLNLKEQILEKDLKDIFREIFVSDIKEIVNLKRNLYKKGCNIGIFSNTFKLAKDLVDELYPEIFDSYDKKNPIVLSYRVNSIKPEEKIYNVIKGYKKVILIDDNYEFVKKELERLEKKLKEDERNKQEKEQEEQDKQDKKES